MEENLNQLLIIVVDMHWIQSCIGTVQKYKTSHRGDKDFESKVN